MTQVATPPKVTRLADYRPPPFLIDQVYLTIHLDRDPVLVQSRLYIRRNPVAAPEADLKLHGQELEMVALRLDGCEPEPGSWSVDNEFLTLRQVPERFALEVENHIRPAQNTSLEGLYISNGRFCTQCEAEGFRKITWYIDRPDVLARFVVALVAPQQGYPLLLANGNRIAQAPLDDERHYVTWEDPFPKPAYLFALVAGDLACVAGTFTTRSGRKVDLRFYTEAENADRCDHALAALKKAMLWDEIRFGREYDLDIYMVVAVNDFNMGAMENKGLNIFNSQYVLAKPTTATDEDFQAIESVIAHEYFHNWTGNRITCRDWFQLSLKEGLTVFRDQEFSADTLSRGVQRIRDVRMLRSIQFAEDGGPTAHPVQPDTYIEINNFYTTTVYNKGAEVVRMLHTLLGEAGFRRGMDLYFHRHDRQAVTVDDFVQALADANDRDLKPFKLWYRQAGTPTLRAEMSFPSDAGGCLLILSQETAPTPGQPEKHPLHIPVRVALLGEEGTPLPLALPGEDPAAAPRERVLELRTARETFHFQGAMGNPGKRPVLSILRGFSAPVRLEVARTDADLAFLWARDNDPFNRWDAGQELLERALFRWIGDLRGGKTTLHGDAALRQAFCTTLHDQTLDPAMRAMALTLPNEKYLLDRLTEADPDVVHVAREFLRQDLAIALEGALLQTYERLADELADPSLSGAYDPKIAGRRALKNVALATVAAAQRPELFALCERQYNASANMTDTMAALTILVHGEAPQGEAAAADFLHKWREDFLVTNKWLVLQASAPLACTFDRVVELTRHPLFNPNNPNRVRALIGGFSSGNPYCFHHPSGRGYDFLGDWILRLDRSNPQVASRLLAPFNRWRSFEPGRAKRMREVLQHLAGQPALSRDVGEMVGKILA
ncbi:MAG: aminopeptidase N [Magnetococcales bacterium]|nr:aminopeptidase N [Magnetococcales bacterium]